MKKHFKISQISEKAVLKVSSIKAGKPLVESKTIIKIKFWLAKKTIWPVFYIHWATLCMKEDKKDKVQKPIDCFKQMLSKLIKIGSVLLKTKLSILQLRRSHIRFVIGENK